MSETTSQATEPREMAASRVVAGDVDQIFARVLPMRLDQLFAHWYGPIPPVRSTAGPTLWGTLGQQRRVNFAGPGWVTETLTEIVPPHHFSYRLTDVHGPMRTLIAAVDGSWAFAQAGAGTEVTWLWRVTPRRYTRLLLPAFAWLWQGYANRVLLTLDLLLRERT